MSNDQNSQAEPLEPSVFVSVDPSQLADVWPMLPVDDKPECPKCRSLQAVLNAANRDLIDLTAQLTVANAKLVDALHWQHEYRRQLQMIKSGFNTTNVGE